MFRAALFAAGLAVASPALGQSPSEPDQTTKTLVGLLTKQLKDRDWKKRVDAAKELGNLGAKARDAGRALCEACMDGSGRVSVAAIDAIEKVRPELHKHLVTIVSDASTANHERAFLALAELKDEASAATPLVLAYIRRRTVESAFRNYRSPAMKCLAAIASDDTAWMNAAGVIIRQYPNSTIAGEFLAMLGRLGEAKAELRKKILPTLLVCMSTDNKLEAVQAVGRLGPDAKDAMPLLLKLRFDSDGAVRIAANEAIAKIEDKP